MSSIFEISGPLRPGDVSLCFAGSSPAKYLLGTWLQTVAKESRAKDPGLAVIVVGIDRAVLGKHSVSAALEELRGRVPALDFPEPDIIELQTEEAEACLRSLPFVRGGATVALMDAERLRFSDLERQGPEIVTVDNTVLRLSERDDLALPHIERLCAEICRAAGAAEQKFLIVCRGYGFGRDVPEALKQIPNLDICQVTGEREDDGLAAEFRRILINLHEIGLEVALDWVGQNLPAGKVASLAKANLLLAAKLPWQAYEAMQNAVDEILADGMPEELLQCAQTAAAAGDRPAATQWLGRLPAPVSFQFECLRSACVLASKLHVPALAESCRCELSRRFPSHPFTLHDRYGELIDKGDFPGAAETAERMGDAFRKEAALYLGSGDGTDEDLLGAAKAVGELPNAYWIIARAARRRGDLPKCREYARKLTSNSEYGGRAAAMRAQALSEQWPDINKDDFAEEFEMLVCWCAEHPEELEARFAFEAIFDSVTVGRECMVHAAYFVHKHCERLLADFAVGVIPGRCPLEQASRTEHTSGALNFIKALFQQSKGEDVPLGLARLSPEMRAAVTPELMADLGSAIVATADRGEPKVAMMLLQTVLAITRDTDDPCSDLVSAKQTVSVYARFYGPQKALDLAEGLVLLLPAHLPTHKAWRRSTAWAIYSDVSQRLGNPMAAVRYLCFAACTLTQPPLHLPLYLDLFRLVARVFRDLRLWPLALMTIKTELKLLDGRPDPHN